MEKRLPGTTIVAAMDVPGQRERAPLGGDSPRAAFAVSAADWFVVVATEPGVTLVAEPGHVFNWLISGSERSVLLDTGMGIADVAAAIEPHAERPVSVVNSHVHFDHVGGNHLFADVAAHELAPARIAAGCDLDHVEAYRRIAPGFRASFERLRDADRDGWFVLGPEEEVRDWPAPEIEAQGWTFDPPPPVGSLVDGDVIDLSDRSLRVLHTPGHAAEHICLLDERAGLLWAQEQAYYGPQLLYLDGSDVTAYARSARRLAVELAGSIRAVYVAHCLRPAVPPRFLVELADAAEEVAAGEAQLAPVTEMFGERVLEADYGHFSIQVPAVETPAER